MNKDLLVKRYLLLAVVFIVVLLPLTLLSLREFQDDATLPISNLNRSVSGVLRKLPGVDHIELHRILLPTHRIIQIRDHHFIPKDSFTIELQSSSSHQLSDEEIDRQYQEFLDDVESLQEEQMELLRALIKKHGLKRIHAEGFSEEDLPAYRERIAELKFIQDTQIPKFKQQLNEVRDLLADKPTPEARSIERKILAMLDNFQIHLIEVGAAGRLLINGEIVEVLPIEDAETLEQSSPISQDKKLQLEKAKTQKRHDAIVRNILKNGPCSLIILGGEHDLLESTNRIGGGKCEYITVTTKKYRHINGE